MSRINIEDSLFKDQRWFQLLIKTGCRHKALGMVTDAWIIAQEHWIKSGNVPKKAWPKDLNLLIDVELAVLNSDGSIYVKGSKSAFAWLHQRAEAGRKGGIKKRVQNEPNSKEDLIKKNGARVVLSKAIQSGNIIKPKECQSCGNGGVIIEGHHSDYSKPLEVDWVCKKCHARIHRLLREAEAKRPLDSVNHSIKPANAPSPSPSLSPTQTQTHSQLGRELVDQRPTHPLIEIWNTYRGGLSFVEKSNTHRDRNMKARWVELSKAEWIDVIKIIAASKFCNGDNERGWKANFDFLIKPGTWLKAKEGVYSGTRSNHGMTEDGRYLTPAVKRSHNNRIMIEKYLKPKGENDEQLIDAGPGPVDSGVS